MKVDYEVEIEARLGADRVLSPARSLPQPAQRLDADGPVRPFEFEVAVERLCLDSTSHRQIRDSAGADPGGMAVRIAEIVRERGKMHNPETDSGGILVGTVSAVGDRVSDPPEVGDAVITLGSLTLTPLRLATVGPVDPASPQVPVAGTAYVCDRAPWTAPPPDLPLERALEVLDVCAAASHVRAFASEGASTCCVLGSGHAGRLALAAARDAMPGAEVVAVDVDPVAVERAVAPGLADRGVVADLRDPLGSLAALRDAGIGPSDLTVVVVNATGCESAAILCTADTGTALFFSMATSFSAAALTADSLASSARIVIGTGYASDEGAYALELVRGSAALRDALGIGPLG